MSDVEEVFGLTDEEPTTEQRWDPPGGTSRAALTRRLIDHADYGPIEAHMAVTQGTVPEEYLA